MLIQDAISLKKFVQSLSNFQCMTLITDELHFEISDDRSTSNPKWWITIEVCYKTYIVHEFYFITLPISTFFLNWAFQKKHSEYYESNNWIKYEIYMFSQNWKFKWKSSDKLCFHFPDNRLFPNWTVMDGKINITFDLPPSHTYIISPLTQNGHARNRFTHSSSRASIESRCQLQGPVARSGLPRRIIGDGLNPRSWPAWTTKNQHKWGSSSGPWQIHSLYESKINISYDIHYFEIWKIEIKLHSITC